MTGTPGWRNTEEAPVKEELYRVSRLIMRIASCLHLSPRFGRQELARIRKTIDIADAYLAEKGYQKEG